MKKIATKMLSLFLAVLMICTLVPMNAEARGGNTFNLTVEVKYVYTNEQGKLILEDAGSYIVKDVMCQASGAHQYSGCSVAWKDFHPDYVESVTEFEVRENFEFWGWQSTRLQLNASDGYKPAYDAFEYTPENYLTEKGENKYTGLTYDNTMILVFKQGTTESPDPEPTPANVTVTLNYDANGGKGAPASESQTVKEGESAIFTVSSTQPTKSGYTFKGWDTSSEAKTVVKNPGETLTTSEETTTLYAVWEEESVPEVTYKLNYDLKEGVDAANFQQQRDTNSTGSATFTIYTNEPTKEGFEFKGWDTSSEAKTVVKNPGETLTTSEETTTLYAVWEEESVPEVTYKLNYDLKEGVDAANFQQQRDTNSTGSATFTIYTNEPTKEGFEFKGWDTSSEAKTVVKNPGETLTTSEETTTLYAVWEEVAAPATVTVTLNYDANGGKGAPASESQTVKEGESATFTVSSTKPTRSGYTFKGWAETADAEKAQYQAGDKITISTASTAKSGDASATKSVTLYAVWGKKATTTPTTTPEDNKKDESKPVSTHPASTATQTYVSPKTGDNSAIVLMSSLLILGIAGFVSVYVFQKKRNAR